MADEMLPEGTDAIIEGAAGPSEPTRHEASKPSDTAETGKALPAEAGDGATSARSTTTSRDDDGGTGNVGGGFVGGGSWSDRIEGLKAQGYDQARAYAVSGKDRATGAIDELIRMVNDAAAQIDQKVGTNYGDYARRAVDSLATFNDGLKNRDVDDLFDEARALVAKAPAVAVGTAAALGFVVARLARAGLPDEGTPAPKAAPGA